MINLEEFNQKLMEFEIWRKANSPKFSEMEALRLEFIKKFPINNLKDLSLDQYVIGKPDSFCYWLEIKLASLGSIRGSSAFKFGIYLGKTKTDSHITYRFTQKFGSGINVGAEEVYETVRSAIIQLLIDGRNKDFQAIDNNLLSPMFKGKILSIYYPEIYLNVFSEDYLRRYLIRLGMPVSETSKDTFIYLSQRLIAFKNTNPIMLQWSNIEYGYFLGMKYGSQEYSHEEVFKESDNPLQLPSISNINAEELKNEIVNFEEDKNNKDFSEIKSDGQETHFQNRDYVKEAKNNTIVGNRGEEIILEEEKKVLHKAGRNDLADKVRRVSKDSNIYGYDIHSYTLNGEDKYIEVKSTRMPFSQFSKFIISANEYEKGLVLKDKYYICWVFSTSSSNPKFLYIKNPFGNKDKFTIEPKSYNVGFQFSTEILMK